MTRAGRSVRVLLWFFSLLPGCADLPHFETGECGNGVVDAGEDCDTFTDAPFECRSRQESDSCRFACSLGDGAGAAPCPPGLVCSSDGVCREPTGVYDAAPTPLAVSPTSWLSALDFDGDGRDELLATGIADEVSRASFSLHFFESSAASTIRDFPLEVQRPSIADVSLDGRSDIVFSADSGIGLIPGRQDRLLFPKEFSRTWTDSLAEARVLPLGIQGRNELETLGVLAPSGAVSTEVLVIVEDGVPRSVGKLPYPMSTAVSAVSADVLVGPSSPCPELVVAFPGRSEVHVLDFCDGLDDSETPRVRSAVRDEIISLPGSGRLTGSALVGNVDGDEFPDVVVASDSGYYVVRGGQSQLNEPYLWVIRFVDESWQVLSPSLLALPDINGDGVADLLTGFGLFSSLSSSPSTFGSVARYEAVTQAFNLDTFWNAAIVADVNGDGIDDVAVGRSGAATVTVFHGTRGYHPVRTKLTLEGPLNALTAGDLDGDGRKDLVFVEGGASGNWLTIAYGAELGARLQLVRVAQLTDASHAFVRGHFHFGDVITTSDGASGRKSLSTFYGGPERVVLSQKQLPPTEDPANSPVSLATLPGRFRTAGVVDVLSLASDESPASRKMWLLPNLSARSPEPLVLHGDASILGEPLTLAFQEAVVSLHVAAAAADLTGDEIDEAVWLMPAETGACRLTISQVHERQRDIYWEVGQTMALGTGCSRPFLAASDLGGGDPHRDLVALVDEPPPLGRHLKLLWNDGTGGFDPERGYALKDERDIQAVAVFPHGARKLAYVTADSLVVADFTTTEPSVSKVAADFVDARAVAVLDVDGNGSFEIAVADERGLWLVKEALR